MKPKKHQCELNLGSDSMLPLSKTWLGNLWRRIRKLGQLSMHHPETPFFFQSYSAVVAERQRQLLEEGYRVIHPLSILSLSWITFMIIVNFCHMIISPFRLFFVLQPLNRLTLMSQDHILLVFHFLCLLDIIVKFNMGYVDRKFRTISVDRKAIAWNYIKSWFFLDLISCLPFAFVLLTLGITRSHIVLIAHVLPLFRITRSYTIIANLRTIIQLFSSSFIVQGIVRLPVVLLLSVHWGTCLMYLPPVITYYWTGTMPLKYNYYLHKFGGRNLLNHSITMRYTKAIVIVVSAFFGTGVSMFHSNLPDELLIHSCIIIYAAIIMVFTLVFLIKSYLTIYDSELHYNGLMNQVEEYLTYRQFPVPLRKRVIAFYEFRYQEHYFKGCGNLDALSEELRDEVRLYTCRVLIDKVKIFQGIPASTVGTILGCLHPEVYLANDLVLASGEIGNCMYFIATGTVAVYSLKGVEICHLGDGGHFGEVALLVKDRKRSVTVVAVETTQMYRLDLDDFRHYICQHPTLSERIGALAARRMHETVLIDEACRQEKEQRLRPSVELERSGNLVLYPPA